VGIGERWATWRGETCVGICSSKDVYLVWQETCFDFISDWWYSLYPPFRFCRTKIPSVSEDIT
jgi:hypothetical protein